MKKINLLFILFFLLTATCVHAQQVFYEDFGTSPFPTSSNDYGRKQSPYMPTGGFGYGTSYVNTNNASIYKIDDNYYAVVAPGYIRAGINPSNPSSWCTTGSGAADGRFCQPRKLSRICSMLSTSIAPSRIN